MLALILGYVLDLIIGDPQGAPHPVRLIGNMISSLENNFRKRCKCSKDERAYGILLWLIVVSVSTLTPALILFIIKSTLPKAVYIMVEGIMCYYILATKSLKDESMKVYYKLREGNISEARRFLSYIVGRDTENLNETEISRACIETVAENTSDGVIAPLIFIIIGGAPLGFFYKAVNTLDSMVGYKNEKYINIGRFSAKADDAVNFIPARLSAILMILSSYVIKYDYKNALKIYKRDRHNHPSPNSAHTESVCAGALDIQLGGGSYYGGVFVKKKTLGDDIRPLGAEDIKKSNKLMYTTSLLCFIIGLIIRYAIILVV